MTPRDLVSMGKPEFLELPLRYHLGPTSDRPDLVYFIESGIASVVIAGKGQQSLELGLVGHEGMADISPIFGDDQSPFETYMQVGGTAYGFSVNQLRASMARRPQLNALILRYSRAFTIQIASTALANGTSTLHERLCRWLLMLSDRVGPSFEITHQFISMMLAVRRSGVTLALQVLEGEGLVRARRGAIRILDRKALVQSANGAYGFAEREYARLLG